VGLYQLLFFAVGRFIECPAFQALSRKVLPELDASEGIPVMPPVKPLTLWYKDDPDDYPPRRLFLDLVKFLEDRLDRHGAHFDAKGSCRR